MKFTQTPLQGCYVLDGEPKGDARGYFMRTFCGREFAAHGLNPNLAQASISYNQAKGTLRGLHYQAHPALEDKLVRCLRGAIFDVMVDLRPASPTFGQWYGTELSADNHRQLYAPQGFAHGFQALTDDVIVQYHIAQYFVPELTEGVFYADPDIGIAWPLEPTNLSPRDLTLPRLKDIDLSKIKQ